MEGKYENFVALGNTSFDVNTAADKLVVGVPFKCCVIRAEVHVHGTDTGGCTIKFDGTINGGTRGDGDLGDITVPASDQSAVVLYDKVGEGTILQPNDVVTVQVTAESVTALVVVARLIVDYIPETEANLTGLTLTA